MFALLLITFVNFVGIGALIPVLPYTVIENLGYSETVMTALFWPALPWRCLLPIPFWAGYRIAQGASLFYWYR